LTYARDQARPGHDLDRARVVCPIAQRDGRTASLPSSHLTRKGLEEMKTVKLSFTKSVRNIVSAIVVLLACMAVAVLVGFRATEARAADLKPNRSSITAPAATFTVNTTADPSPSNGLCGGTCSLRYAVNSANLTSGATIGVPAGMYALALGAITISQDMSIVGAGAISTTVDGGGADRIFIVGPSTTIKVSLSGMTLQRGFSPGLGGAIQAYGNLTLDSVTLFNNIANN
jgi:CSLREA domain-containing protein